MKILIANNDPTVLTHLKSVFEKDGYSVTTVRTGSEVQKIVPELKPDLVVLDVELSEIDGYELCRRIKTDPRTNLIPVIFLTYKREPKDKVKGLKAGALDYVTIPFQREELLARVHNILESFRTRPPLTAEKSVSRDSFLEKLQAMGIDVLKPAPNTNAKLGFHYPQVKEIIQVEDEEEQIGFLESLADKGILERIFFDVIHLCPFCGHHDINRREVCPKCHSAHVKRRNNHYLCADCGNLFSYPEEYARCLKCNREFHREEIRSRVIHSYKFLNGKSPIPQEKIPLKEALKAMEMRYYEMDFFEKQLDLEIRRSQRYGERTSIMIVEFVNLGEVIERGGLTGSLKPLNRVLLILKKCLRELDLVAVKSSNQLIILMPETPLSMAKLLANRIRSYVDRLNCEISLNLSLAGSPEDGERGRELMKVAEQGLRQIKAGHSGEVFASI